MSNPNYEEKPLLASSYLYFPTTSFNVVIVLAFVAPFTCKRRQWTLDFRRDTTAGEWQTSFFEPSLAIDKRHIYQKTPSPA